MNSVPGFREMAKELIDAGHFFFSRGWVPATSGNFSARLDARHIAITASGRHKGQLDARDILIIDSEGRHVTTDQPKSSAETPLHLALYRRDASIGAVLHTHSVNATVLSLLCRDALWLDDYEVLKAFPDVDSHEARVRVPIFPNDQDTERLALAVDRYLDDNPRTHGYLIAGHGFYTWGNSVTDARRHVEAFEFLFDCEVLMRRIGP